MRRELVRVRLWTVAAVALLVMAVVSLLTLGWQPLAVAQQPLAKPPADQVYVGAKQCAACHLEEYMTWRNTAHAKAFANMPAKYHTDGECLQCHTTAFGQPSGYTGAETANLAGITCEVCHGPGSKHVEISKQYATKEELSEQDIAYVKSTIYEMLPKNVCIECHVTKAHKGHPDYDK